MYIHDRIRENTTIQTGFKALYGIFLFIDLLRSILYHGFTHWSGEPHHFLDENMVSVIMLVLVCILACAELLISKPRAILCILAVLIRQFVPVVIGIDRLLEMYILILLSNLGGVKVTTRVWLAVHIAFIFLLFYLKQHGLVTEVEKIRSDGRIYSSFGLSHPNSVALIIMTLVMMIRLVYIKKRLWIYPVICVISVVVTIVITDCRTIAALLILAPLLEWILRKIRIDYTRNAIIFALMPFCCLIISLLLSWYCLALSSQNLSDPFWVRFREFNLIIEYFHFPFGTAINPGYEIYFDNFYYYLIALCGFIPALIVIGSYCFMNWTLAKRGEYVLLTISVVFVLYSLMECVLFYPVHFFVPLLAFAERKKMENYSAGILTH